MRADIRIASRKGVRSEIGRARCGVSDDAVRRAVYVFHIVYVLQIGFIIVGKEVELLFHDVDKTLGLLLLQSRF